MANDRMIEEECGTYTGRILHPHNGYYAGDFHTSRRPAAWPTRPSQPGPRSAA